MASSPRSQRFRKITWYAVVGVKVGRFRARRIPARQSVRNEVLRAGIAAQHFYGSLAG